MSVITISRQYGSDGRTVGQLLAQTLAYRLVDKDLIAAVALRARASIEEVERYDERPEHTLARAFRRLLVPVHAQAQASDLEYGWGDYGIALGEELQAAPVDEDTCVQVTQEVIRHLAASEDIVLIGRGGNHAVTDLAVAGVSVLHVRIVAPMEFRIDTVVERDTLRPETAADDIHRVDKQRRLYIKRLYGVAWDNPEHYDLVLNTGKVGVAGAVSIVEGMARNLPRQQGRQHPLVPSLVSLEL